MSIDNTGMILTLAYPETIVRVADEWYSPLLRYIGVGKKNYLRAGHAALVLINKSTGELEYHDFGRYITPEPMGRVRGKDTDGELDFPLKAEIVSGAINNLDVILKFLATNPKLTHGEGTLYASVCEAIDYDKARTHITKMQSKQFVKYAAFESEACNCARFVTDTLIASTTDPVLKKRLQRSKWFTPSTIGGVVASDTIGKIHQVDGLGNVSLFSRTVTAINRACFLDRLKTHKPNFEGALMPKSVDATAGHAQWLPGIAAGAWFELHIADQDNVFLFKRISPHGNIDIEALFEPMQRGFDYHSDYRFVQYSNCKFFHIEQGETIYRFERVD